MHFFLRRAVLRPMAVLPAICGLCSCNTMPATITPGSSVGAASSSSGATSNTTSTAAVNFTALEQLSLERINRARLRPGPEAAFNNIAIDEAIPGRLNADPKQPLAQNATLLRTATAHSQDMINLGYFAHDTPAGLSPFQRMKDAGFLFVTAGENLAWRGTTGTLNEALTVENEHVDLFVDSAVPGRGHRTTMLEQDFREVGIGIVRGKFTDAGTTYDTLMQTQDFGTAVNSGTFVLGVVYNDVNGNGQYDYGEGIANSSVQLDTTTQMTGVGGGYVFEVHTPGNYTLRFLTASKSQPLTIYQGAPNVKVDLVGGNPPLVNLGLGPL